MTEANMIPVEVAYALPDKQEIVMLEVEPGTTVSQAAERSDIARHCPQIRLAGASFGIFGKAVQGDQTLHAGDRVEIYRPLLADPKEIRKQRAAKAKQRRKQRESSGSSGSSGSESRL